jgi:hypothetical protein
MVTDYSEMNKKGKALRYPKLKNPLKTTGSEFLKLMLESLLVP